MVFLALSGAIPAYANGIPALPHAVYGSVTLNGAAAPDGTPVSAVVDSGSVITNAQNPTTTVGGSYGINSPMLLVQGDISDGATITFYVNGVSTGQTANFQAGGGPTEKNLTVTITAGVGGIVLAPDIEATLFATLFGEEAEFSISTDGEIQETIEATSADGNLTVTIPKDTTVLDKDGNPLSSLTLGVDESPPQPPEGANIIGLAYEFGPDGATFNPPITLTWSYDPDDLPEGVDEGDLVVAYYAEDADKWVELDSTVDTENNTITASVSHFKTFAIIGAVKLAAFALTLVGISPTEVSLGEEVTITVSVTNSGGTEGSYTVVLNINDVKEAEKDVTVAADGHEIVTFIVTKEQAGDYAVMVDGLGDSFTVVAPVTPAPAAFLVSDLSIEPAEVKQGEAVTISLLVANTGDESGDYTVTLKINGVKEAEKSVTVTAGGSQSVTFSVIKEESGSYSLAVDGLSGSFTVVALVTPPAEPPINWPLISGIIAAVVAVGLLIFLLVRRVRRAG